VLLVPDVSKPGGDDTADETNISGFSVESIKDGLDTFTELCCNPVVSGGEVRCTAEEKCASSEQVFAIE